jgi:hypothetical protein
MTRRGSLDPRRWCSAGSSSVTVPGGAGSRCLNPPCRDVGEPTRSLSWLAVRGGISLGGKPVRGPSARGKHGNHLWWSSVERRGPSAEVSRCADDRSDREEKALEQGLRGVLSRPGDRARSRASGPGTARRASAAKGRGGAAGTPGESGGGRLIDWRGPPSEVPCAVASGRARKREAPFAGGDLAPLGAREQGQRALRTSGVEGRRGSRPRARPRAGRRIAGELRLRGRGRRRPRRSILFPHTRGSRAPAAGELGAHSRASRVPAYAAVASDWLRARDRRGRDLGARLAPPGAVGVRARSPRLTAPRTGRVQAEHANARDVGPGAGCQGRPSAGSRRRTRGARVERRWLCASTGPTRDGVEERALFIWCPALVAGRRDRTARWAPAPGGGGAAGCLAPREPGEGGRELSGGV